MALLNDGINRDHRDGLFNAFVKLYLHDLFWVAINLLSISRVYGVHTKLVNSYYYVVGNFITVSNTNHEVNLHVTKCIDVTKDHLSDLSGN